MVTCWFAAQWPGLAQAKTITRSFLWVSLPCGAGTSTWTILHCSPKRLSGKLDCKWNSRDLNQGSNSGHAGGGLRRSPGILSLGGQSRPSGEACGGQVTGQASGDICCHPWESMAQRGEASMQADRRVQLQTPLGYLLPLLQAACTSHSIPPTATRPPCTPLVAPRRPCPS